MKITEVGGQPFIDYMARDYESLLGAMRERIPQKLPEWRDFTNEADFGNVLLELFAHMGDILSYYQDRVANESFLSTARTRRSVIEHLRLIGYQLSTAAPSTTVLAVAVPAEVKAKVQVHPGDAFATSSTRERPGLRFEYIDDAPITIDFSTVAVDPGTAMRVYGPAQGGIPVKEGRQVRDELLGVSDGRVYRPAQGGIPVKEGRQVRDELLGVSDGTPNQRFALIHSRPIIRPPDSTPHAVQDLQIRTRLVGEATDWTRRESLAFSVPGMLDYVVEVDAEDRATIVFGDGRGENSEVEKGRFGTIPTKGAEIRATYRVGGGRAGNVPPHAIATIIGAPQLVRLGAKVYNPFPATSGAEREDIMQAVRRAPAVFRSLRRAVTAADYEALALSFNGVGKVRAFAAGWNRVWLYVAPEGGGGNVSDVLEADLLGYFEDKRMLSQIVEIKDVTYVAIHVTAEIGIESFFVPSEVVAAVERTAAELLAFDRVGFGDTVHLSRFYDRIQDVPGVVFVNITEFRRGDSNGPLIAEHGTIELGPHEVPRVPIAPGYETGLKVEPIERGRLST
ncbi:baseplate J/gp47 family protein [Streptomyces sp. NBC_00638]|uniref:baseplate J/gp47 family protein n=1 Tax=unclassified Streptomyces TaxID=2593676 RepID=UPI00225259F5|nr:baseplate J/gp47 family protein [Streptomyces sp. NBC_00638]MCX5001194.1 baseplate J/gp47 family protein [Streptomyces sp. NBC_00638]